MFMGLDSNEILTAGLCAIGFIVAIFTIIAYWIVYRKAGEKGWKCLIPFYNDYIFYKFSWNVKFFFIFLPFTLIYLGISIIQRWFIDCFFGNNLMIETLLILLFICLIAILVINIIKKVKLAKSFGKGVLFTLGLIFFEPIFVMILAFGKSKYVGNSAEIEAGTEIK